MSFERAIVVFRPHRPGIRNVPGHLEADMMEVTWVRQEHQRITVHEIFATISMKRQIASTTVMGAMARLAKTRLFQVEKKDQIYKYEPTITYRAFIPSYVNQMLEERFFDVAKETLRGTHPLSGFQEANPAQQLLDRMRHRRTQEE
jgi:predicted transcriptional regulator